MKSRTTPYDIQLIPRYPDELQIYRIPASSHWQCRYFVDKKYLRKSTKTDDKAEAIMFAKELYEVSYHQVIRRRTGQSLSGLLFESFVPPFKISNMIKFRHGSLRNYACGFPMKPAMHSELKPATCSDPKPAGVPI